jgi:hypothetical protein
MLKFLKKYFNIFLLENIFKKHMSPQYPTHTGSKPMSLEKLLQTQIEIST